MTPLYSSERCRSFDAFAVESCHVPALVLMENAGRGAADAIVESYPEARRFALVVGAGNNAGDGFVVARRLLVNGRSVTTVALDDPERLRGDAAVNYRAWLGVGGAIDFSTKATIDDIARCFAQVDVIIDAVFGTGLDRAVTGRFAEGIRSMNQAAKPIVSLDLPSGLNGTTGKSFGVSVAAALTVTFGQLKLGLYGSEGSACRGRLKLVDIGLPAALFAAPADALLVEASDIAPLLPPRATNLHKGKAGHVQVIAGSPGKTGAALLVAHAALRSGAGLCTLLGETATVSSLDQKVIEVMTRAISPSTLIEQLASASSVVIGPGLGFGSAAERFIQALIFEWDGVKIVDADALTHFTGRAAELAQARGQLVLTPHPAELGRLLGLTALEVEANRFEAVTRAAGLTGSVVVLKGAHTLIAGPRSPLRVNSSGTPALATAGAGDVLAGVMGALVCSMPPLDAATAAVFLHGRAGEAWVRKTGADRGLLAHEIADQIPGCLAELLARA